jgi:hypothetical protein
MRKCSPSLPLGSLNASLMKMCRHGSGEPKPKLFRFVDCIGRERRKMALDIKVIIIAAVLMAGHALSFILWISGWFVSAKILIFHFIFPFFFEICNHFTI